MLVKFNITWDLSLTWKQYIFDDLLTVITEYKNKPMVSVFSEVPRYLYKYI